jgi:histidyl-tRNA synthetase
LGEAAELPAMQLLMKLREAGLRCDRDYTGKSLRKQMQLATKHSARYCLIIGEDEANQGTLQLKDLSTGEQQQVPWNDPPEELLGILRQSEAREIQSG